MKAVFDVLRISFSALLDCFIKPKKLPARSWLSEYTFRLAKQILHESKTKPIPWLRERQKLLKMYSPLMLKTTKQYEVIADVPCVIYKPSSLIEPSTVIVYLHGGGYVVGSAEGYSLTLANLAISLQANVIGVEYRLAPEHPITTVQEDCLKVAEYIMEARQVKGNKVILMGDSAGGGLCLATIQSLAKLSGKHQPDACVLISPWIAPLDENGLTMEHEQSDILDKALLDRWVSEFVLDKSKDAQLVDFRLMDLTNLPPLYIQAAGSEVFLKQILNFSKALNTAKIPHEIDIFEQQFHVFQTFAPLVKQADTAFQKITVYISRL